MVSEKENNSLCYSKYVDYTAFIVRRYSVSTVKNWKKNKNAYNIYSDQILDCTAHSLTIFLPSLPVKYSRLHTSKRMSPSNPVVPTNTYFNHLSSCFAKLIVTVMQDSQCYHVFFLILISSSSHDQIYEVGQYKFSRYIETKSAAGLAAYTFVWPFAE